MISKIKAYIKPFVVNNKIWDRRRAQLYFKSRKYAELPSTEKTKKRVITYSNNRTKQYCRLMKSIDIQIEVGKRFQHWIDTGLCFSNRNDLNDSLPPDYSLIINQSINELIADNEKIGNDIAQQNVTILYGIKKYISRILNEIDDIRDEDLDDKLLISRLYFCRMIDSKAETLEEGLQRILFWSSLFWQSRHCMIGLGRLDVILDELKCPQNGDELKEMIRDFFDELHRYYNLKSNALLGDTGQLIVLGGVNADGIYFFNDLTKVFINVLKEMQIPDPKILLRVSECMPNDILEEAVRCIATGIGCPLLANDDVIIPSLESFGYSHEDASNYVTSACWEPFSYGSSWGRGNLGFVNFALAFQKMYEDEKFVHLNSFSEVVEFYKQKLLEVTNCIVKHLDNYKWDENPLMTLLSKGCIESNKDIANGGVIYPDYGILLVGVANAVDSLFNIKKVVFEEEICTLDDVCRFLNNNGILNTLQLKKEINKSWFGHDNNEVLELVGDLSNVVRTICSNTINRYGGKVKYGFSSPSYIVSGEVTRATFDGRHDGEPLAVHISARETNAYTEILNFAGKIDYNCNACNGNVVDLMCSPDFISRNFDKFVWLIRASMGESGFFELQMNVVSSNVLIEAKYHPEKHKELIVRVWGFSSYFNDLPDEYKDVLIKRALQNEGKA